VVTYGESPVATIRSGIRELRAEAERLGIEIPPDAELARMPGWPSTKEAAALGMPQLRWPAASVQLWPLAQLKPRARNPRTHSEQQIEQIAASMREWGWTNPILVEPDGTIIAGHGRYLGAKKCGFEHAPVIVARGWTPAQVRAYVIADNKLAENAGWDRELLAVELADLADDGYQLELLGFSDDELAALETLNSPPANPDAADEVPEVAAVPVSRLGEVWILGKHRVMCGDSRRAELVAVLMNGEKARLLHADPPYGMGKEADGVANDNLYGDKLDRFQMEWWRACRPFLESNASAYVWGNSPDLWRLWYRRQHADGAGFDGLDASEQMTFRNEIVWDKKSIAGMASEDMTQYPEASERCLFFQLGRYVFLVNQTKDDYWEGWEPIRRWMCAQRDAADLSPAQIKKACGNHMYGHWFGRSQWVFISRDNYEKLQELAKGKAFERDYDDLRREYSQLKAVFDGEIRDPRAENFRATRPYFDNAHAVMRDVWEFPRVVGEEREGHATPKPVDMCERVMRSSLRDGELALEPFGGSGSTLIGAHRSGRRCYLMEIDPLWVDVSVRRWQKYSGLSATLEGDGRTFQQVEHERTQAKALVPARA
jgi:DNA modification methylase